MVDNSALVCQAFDGMHGRLSSGIRVVFVGFRLGGMGSDGIRHKMRSMESEKERKNEYTE